MAWVSEWGANTAQLGGIELVTEIFRFTVTRLNLDYCVLSFYQLHHQHHMMVPLAPL